MYEKNQDVIFKKKRRKEKKKTVEISRLSVDTKRNISMYGVECWVNCFMQKRLQFANLVGLGWLYNAAVLISVTVVLITYSILKINRLRILMQAMQNVATEKG